MHAHNYASRSECFTCQAPKLVGVVDAVDAVDASMQARLVAKTTNSANQQVLPGDWKCPRCNAHNYASRSECFTCRAPKLVGTVDAVDASMQARLVAKTNNGASQQVRPGDWKCPRCDAYNYASRSECFKCRTQKTEVVRPGGGEAEAKRRK